MADELGVILQETLNMGLDRLFFERGQPPIERASARRRPARAQDAGEGDITSPAIVAWLRGLPIAEAGVRLARPSRARAKRLRQAVMPVASLRRARDRSRLLSHSGRRA